MFGGARCVQFSQFVKMWPVSMLGGLLVFVFIASVCSKHSDYKQLPASVEAALTNASNARTDIETVLSAWSLFADRAPIWANKWVNLTARPQLEAILNKTSQSQPPISEDCRKSLFATLDSIEKLDDWAIKCECIYVYHFCKLPETRIIFTSVSMPRFKLFHM